MFDGTTFGKTLYILERSMEVSSLRYDVISNNLANGNTPNFKRSEVSFEAQLSQALAAEQTPVVSMRKTDPRHLNPFESLDYRSVEPRRSLDYLSQSGNNGNNVDVQKEFGDSLKTQMSYSFMNKAVGYQFRQIKKMLS